MTAVPLLFAVGAACNDESDAGRLAKERWIEEADAICADENAALTKLDEPAVDPFDPGISDAQLAEAADFLAASVRIQDRATARLEELGLPDEDAGDIEDALELREDGRAHVVTAVDAARTQNAELFAQEYRAAVSDYDEAAQEAREFGLQECGQG
jgi:hypothetical protein